MVPPSLAASWAVNAAVIASYALFRAPYAGSPCAAHSDSYLIKLGIAPSGATQEFDLILFTVVLAAQKWRRCARVASPPAFRAAAPSVRRRGEAAGCEPPGAATRLLTDAVAPIRYTNAPSVRRSSNVQEFVGTLLWYLQLAIGALLALTSLRPCVAYAALLTGGCASRADAVGTAGVGGLRAG